jgi:BMFP domain-containing protein YqiC
MTLQKQHSKVATNSTNYVAGVIYKFGHGSKQEKEIASTELVTISTALSVDKARDMQSISQFTLYGIQQGKDGLGYCQAVIKIFLLWMQQTINVTHKMDDVQLIQCAIMISKEYRMLSFEDLLIVCRMIITGKFGTLYNRIDMAVVCDCLNKYMASDAYTLAVERHATSYKKKEVEQPNEYYQKLRDKYLPRIMESFAPDREPEKEISIHRRDTYGQWLQRMATATQEDFDNVMKQAEIIGDRRMIEDLKKIKENEKR